MNFYRDEEPMSPTGHPVWPRCPKCQGRINIVTDFGTIVPDTGKCHCAMAVHPEHSQTDDWHRLSERLPEDMQWIVLIGCPLGTNKNGKCEYITERIYRFEKGKHFDIFRTRVGVDVIFAPRHMQDSVWCALPGTPPWLHAWGEDEKPLCAMNK